MKRRCEAHESLRPRKCCARAAINTVPLFATDRASGAMAVSHPFARAALVYYSSVTPATQACRE